MTASIRTRLTVALISSGTLLLTALGFACHARARALLNSQFDDGLRARAAGLISLLDWESERSVDFDYKGEFMPEFERRSGGYFFELRLAKDGALIERSHSLRADDLPQFTSDAREFREFSLADGSPARAIVLHAPTGFEAQARGQSSEPTGALVVVAGDTTSIDAQLRHLGLELAIACAVGILLVAIIVRRTLAGGLAPLVAFSELAARLDAENLVERFPENHLPGELAPIAARLNAFLSRLETAFARERRFSADVAHELRTPIAELRTLADVGGADPAADPETTAFFHDAREIAAKMNATVSALLLIARCENGGQPVEHAPVDIAVLVSALVAEYEPHTRSREFTLECRVTKGFLIETDAALFTQFARILIDNAVAYTRPGGVIKIGAGDRHFTVANGPTDLAPADLPRLCERFWRKDSARSDPAHAGLGLSIAAEIARLLGTRLTSHLGENSTLEMRVAWATPHSQKGPTPSTDAPTFDIA